MEREFINSLLACNSIKEANEIRDAYSELLENNQAMYMYLFAAKKRLNRLRKAKFENWEIDLLN
jgi:hypothetical protein